MTGSPEKSEKATPVEREGDELERVQELDAAQKCRRIRAELMKVADDNPENIARIIKAWLDEGKR